MPRQRKTRKILGMTEHLLALQKQRGELLEIGERLIMNAWEKGKEEGATTIIQARDAEIERLRAALEAVEWVEADASYSECPWCTNTPEEKHKPDCQRQLALARAALEAGKTFWQHVDEINKEVAEMPEEKRKSWEHLIEAQEGGGE